MNKPLLFFSGSQVMLIPEQYVPHGPKCNLCSGSGYMAYGPLKHTECSSCEGTGENELYEFELEIAKKKAIRVGNLTAEGLYCNSQVTPYVYSEHPTPLAEGYTYDVQETYPLPKVGMIVTVTDESAKNGYTTDQDRVKEHLKIGESYEIEVADIGSRQSSAKLKGCRHWFNSVNLVQIVAIIKPLSQPVPSYINPKLKDVSEADLRAALQEVNRKNEENARAMQAGINDALSSGLRCGPAKPQAKPEQSEDELWSGVEKILWDKRHSVSDTLQELQSKYTITRKP